MARSGNSIDFGDRTIVGNGGSFSSATRGVMGGALAPVYVNTVDYITMSSTGDAIDFDLYEATEDQLKSLNTVATSLENALDALEKDTEFLTQGGVFTEDQIKEVYKAFAILRSSP